jgi:hypothetical protein
MALTLTVTFWIIKYSIELKIVTLTFWRRTVFSPLMSTAHIGQWLCWSKCLIGIQLGEGVGVRIYYKIPADRVCVVYIHSLVINMLKGENMCLHEKGIS